MSADVSIAMAQINPVVGDIAGNTERIAQAAREAAASGAHLVMFPELALTGYPPEDLLLRPSLEIRVAAALETLAATSRDIALLVGLPLHADGKLYNAAALLRDGKVEVLYRKHRLPNYRVFDEVRYFAAGSEAAVFELGGTRFGITICEDIWSPEPAAKAVAAGAEVILNLNASPYHVGKQAEREAVVAERCRENRVPVLYVNQVGAQDELVFDGGSFALSSDGELKARAHPLKESLSLITLRDGEPLANDIAPIAEELATIYDALVVGVRDYVNKNGFKGVVLGLSGGIDSALTLAVAVDALGAERVEAVMMPFKYTSSMSLEDAAAEAKTLGVTYKVMPIEPMFDAFSEALADEFAGLKRDTTEENMQARIRGVLLMAISNKKGYLVLTTGNKSEMAVGYCTLYGDMAGGFDVLKDVSKQRVFALSRYRNTLSPAIPQRVIDRPPSAELAPDQKDEDSLPPYEVLDEILEHYIEHDQSAEAIIAMGFEREQVERVVRLVDINEYKRRQAAIGPRITERGFGRDRRYPITNRWKAGV
ncbi:NAD+ synthase (glutamine-hydrolyzing) [Litorivivens lipolytica]|uniref:Glutamine-dependent NAD(+) synthetase n=1 Tax=Litorivivens lipolytica TaxID=1524264 RepID=A0A7W4W7D7_9GAMM|nr:NAD+ synthase [Litorivivens lipolytica]MBB3048848.1 NAD+ synthase (glutamine-hydrolyzing) [Litorivivens lipolytica]